MDLFTNEVIRSSRSGCVKQFLHPAFLFRGEIADLVDGAAVHLSLSHDAGIASAFVIVER